jgi:DNA (cytosine-5)-methyltransferase 1
LESVELFTGAGGLALGTHAAGFTHLGLVEWNEDACRTLERNARTNAVPGIEFWRVHQADMRLMSFDRFGKVDLVAGGVPCQPFSLGGKHKGQDDSRNLFPEFVRAVRELKPRAFIVENVKGLLRESFRSFFEYVVLQLTYPTVTLKRGEEWGAHLRRLEAIHTKGRRQSLQYNVVYQLLNSADYGVPQTRERVFIVGFRADEELEWHFPQPTHSAEALLQAKWVTGDYWQKHGTRAVKCERRPASLSPHLDQPLATLPWVTVRDAIGDLPEPRADREHKEILNHKLNPGARAYPGHTGSPIDLPAKTLKAGVHGVPGGENMLLRPDGSVRYFSVREAARLQTFPDSWFFEGAWSEAMRQLGNAVPVELAAVVARSVAAKLRAGNGH